jgi:putative nucleotidyltransferase with HDIG domain
MTKNNSNKAQVLVVDDEPLIRDILARKLTESGYKCIQASDGLDALKKLDTYQVDLVLLDISMPGKSGVEVLQDVRAKYPDSAVIMITAIADAEIAINAMKLGACDYVIKPVDPKLLLISIDMALDKRRLILENKDYQCNLEKKVEEQTEKIRDSFLNGIKALAFALEAKDKYTSGHSERVTEIAVEIAEELALPQDMIEKIRLAGLLHDVGKIGVRESVLNKPGELTKEEYENVKSHCKLGIRILTPVIEDNAILDMICHHHERYDGKGYPDGLRDKQISQGAKILAVADAYDNQLSLGARILAISDAYDAMTSDRPYRKAMSPEAALAQLEQGKGTQFDPETVDAFLKVRRKRRKERKG